MSSSDFPSALGGRLFPGTPTRRGSACSSDRSPLCVLYKPIDWRWPGQPGDLCIAAGTGSTGGAQLQALYTRGCPFLTKGPAPGWPHGGENDPGHGQTLCWAVLEPRQARPLPAMLGQRTRGPWLQQTKGLWKPPASTLGAGRGLQLCHIPRVPWKRAHLSGRGCAPSLSRGVLCVCGIICATRTPVPRHPPGLRSSRSHGSATQHSPAGSHPSG